MSEHDSPFGKNLPSYVVKGPYGKHIPALLYSTEDGMAKLHASQTLINATLLLERVYGDMALSGRVDPDSILDRFATHPDVAEIAAWLRKNRRPMSEIGVICYVSLGILSAWEQAPKSTSSKHRSHYRKIERLCQELSSALTETGLTYSPLAPRGFHWLSVADLMTKEEWKGFAKLAKLTKQDASSASEDVILSAFPRLTQVLDRVADKARLIRESGPTHTQPNKKGARRGFFVRGLAKVLAPRYGGIPVSVIAAITTVALNDPTDSTLVNGLLEHS